MGFSNPYFLLGLAGIAVPIAIHLLTRDQIRKVAFPTLRFFAKTAGMVVQRRKFQELFLILMRTALVALLAFVFARPFFSSDPSAAGAVNTARAVVVDLSGSMRREGLPAAARKAATDAVTGVDSAALLTFSDSPELIVAAGAPSGEMESALQQLQPGYGGTRIAEALRRANDLLRSTAAHTKEIVLVSDFDREGWTPGMKLDPGIKLITQPLQPTLTVAGPAIVETEAPNSLVLDNQPASIAVRIANFSDQALRDLGVTFSLDGTAIETQKVNIPAGRSVAARFRHVFDTPGDHLGTVSIGSGETFYFNVRAIPRIPLLVVNGRPSTNPRDDAAFFIAKALAPGEDSPFSVTVVPADELNPTDIAGVNVVVLANVGEVSTAAVEGLSELLNRGGGLFFLPGDQAKPETFNAVFANLAPFKLRQILQARPSDGDEAESLAKIDYEHPIFSVFAAPHHGDLTLPNFARYWETTDTQRSRVLARFEDGRPAMLDRKIGQGLSLGFVSAPDANWNDLPFQSVFLPILHQSIRYLATQTAERTTYSIGEVLPLPEGGSLKGPDGTDTVTVPGFYSVLDKQGAVEAHFAVNASFSEANPSVIPPGEIVAAVESSSDSAVAGLSESGLPSVGPATASNLWWFLLGGLVFLSAAELFVANRTLRH